MFNKIKLLILAIFSIFIFNGCFIDTGNGYFNLKNESSETKNVYITEVWIQEKSQSDTNNWTKIWQGEIKPNDSEFISVEPGHYSVKIYTDEEEFLSYKDYTISYNTLDEIYEGDVVNLSFDGIDLNYEE